MSSEKPIVTDPVHLSTLAGRAVLCLRPNGSVATVFESVQSQLRGYLGIDDAWWPGPHLSLKSFGDDDFVVDATTEPEIVRLAEAWATTTPPFAITVDGSDVFAEDLVPIIRVRSTTELRAALADIRERGEASALPGYADSIAVEDWIFHLSLAYYRGERWSEIERAMSAMVIDDVEEVIDHVELRAFDGGPERLIGRFHLEG